MTRIVAFADGFFSATAPDVSGGQTNYDLLNNQSVAVALVDANSNQLILDSTVTKSWFGELEIERTHDDSGVVVFRQEVSLKAIFNEAGWEFQTGNYVGQDLLLVDADPSEVEQVRFLIDATTGEVTYKTGNMPGTSYSGVVKILSTRISV